MKSRLLTGNAYQHIEIVDYLKIFELWLKWNIEMYSSFLMLIYEEYNNEENNGLKFDCVYYLERKLNTSLSWRSTSYQASLWLDLYHPLELLFKIGVYLI